MTKQILITAGGTGGHVFPAYSLANYLIERKFIVKIATDKRGFEYLKDYREIDIIKITSSPLIKKNIIKFLYSIIIILFSIIKSIYLLLIKRPSIVIGMGGYSSFPICIAASILKIKFIVYENNLIIGKANKYLLPFAKKIFVSYRELEGISPKYNKKVVEVGNILRKEIIEANINNNSLDINENFGILVLGGSQAAKVFAEVLPPVFKKLKHSRIPIKIYQQCQKIQKGQLFDFYKENNIDSEIFDFTHNIINYYSKANLVITRAGASVLGELINLNIPFISIPLPTSAENHQNKNAEFYLKKGYGYLLKEKEIKNKLHEFIISIYKDKSSVLEVLNTQKQYSDKNIFKNLGIELEKILNEKN